MCYNGEMDAKAKIEEQVGNAAVALYMKGTPRFPQCGFSSLAVEILRRCGVSDFTAIDVLADPEIRQAVKEYSDWPTIPQLYIRGEFIGGADIMREMFESGELAEKIPPEARAGG